MDERAHAYHNTENPIMPLHAALTPLLVDEMML
jgi:hypothetical protein